VLEKDEKPQLAGSCEKFRSVTQSEGEKEYPTCKKRRKAN
jgi:hypothetical protein